MPTTSLCLVFPLWLALSSCAADTPTPDKQALSADEVRKVLAALVHAAEENAARPRGRLQGDALLDFYVRRAAEAANADGVSSRSFLAALGVGLDHGDLLRKNLVAGVLLARVEGDEERQRRLRVLGEPTLRGRRDWVQHFAVSAALVALSNADAAESVGIAKEVLDSTGDSGFSFGDLAADYAGIGFAQTLLDNAAEGKRRRAQLARDFRGDDYLPAGVKDLEEDIPFKRFTKEYGGTEDPRFQRKCEAVRRQVQESPGLKPAVP